MRVLRTLAVVLVMTGFAAAAGQARAQAGADAFIRGMAEQAIPVLTNEQYPVQQRTALFRDLLRRGFDMPAIARLVLGRYARTAQPQEIANFTQVFEEYVTQVYVQRFAEFPGTQFRVDGQRSEEGVTVVQSTILRSDGGPPVKMDWRVENKGGRWAVIDIAVESVSMVITQRSEFSSVIQQSGGRVEGLTNALRQKIGR